MDKSMTGDGAVVRSIAERWVHLANVSEPPSGTKAADAVALARAYLDREAEIERLTTGGIIEVAVRNMNVRHYMNHWEGRTEKAEARAADLLKALERYMNAQNWDQHHDAYLAARAAIAAAKGETV